MDKEREEELAESTDGVELSYEYEKPVQAEVTPKSVYSGLVELCTRHAKLYRSCGKFSDLVAFSLEDRSVFAGHFFVIRRGKCEKVVETAYVKMHLDGIPWLTEEEKNIDPVELYRQYYVSVPCGAEKFVRANFKACDVDDMSMQDVAAGMHRNEARVRLEAWLLCAGMDGTLRKVATERFGWKEGQWYCSSGNGQKNGTGLVVKASWFTRPVGSSWSVKKEGGGMRIVGEGGKTLATVCSHDDEVARTIEKAGQTLGLLEQIKREAARLQLETHRYPMAETIQEIADLLAYVHGGDSSRWHIHEAEEKKNKNNNKNNNKNK